MKFFQSLTEILDSIPVPLLEFLMAAAMLILSMVFCNRPKISSWADHIFAKGSARPKTMLLGVFLFALLLHAAVFPFIPERHPSVHDEFSYLLAADTFLNGRLSNPTHPLWEHFEAIHVLSRPTYSSMYPPMQGLILAGGKLLTGRYLAGPWISTAILSALLYWMLLGWVSHKWALIGAFVSTLRIGLFSYWANSYWGGAHAAIGGMLVLGIVPRFVNNPKRRHALLAGLGLLILANSRPFEGLFFALACAVLLVLKIRKNSSASFKKPALFAGPMLLVVLIPGFVATSYYYRQVTGKWTQMPQRENMTHYGHAVLPWDSMRAERIPESEHLRTFYKEQRQYFMESRTLWGFVKTRIMACRSFWNFYVGSILALPLLFFITQWKNYKHLFLAGLIFVLSLAVNPWFFPHYVAPAYGLYWLAAVIGMHTMFMWRPQGETSVPLRFYARMIPLCAGILVVFNAWSIGSGRSQPKAGGDYSPAWHYTGPGNTARASFIAKLERLGGKHLVLVNYGQDYDALIDWVYNNANIDKSPIVFAHSLGDLRDRRLLQYYKDRNVRRVRLGNDDSK